MSLSSDRFESPVYYAKACDVFLIVDRGAEAKRGDYVSAEIHAGGRILVQQYDGQKHHGVVRILEFWRLEHSEQFPVMPSGKIESKPKFCKKPRRPRMPRQPRMPRWPRELAC